MLVGFIAEIVVDDLANRDQVAVSHNGMARTQPQVAASGTVAWTRHPHVPQAIPLPNIIGMPPFRDGEPCTVSPSKGEHGAEILGEHGYARNEIDALIRSGILVIG